MIKYLRYKTEQEAQKIKEFLYLNNICHWNICTHAEGNIISFFYNEDFQTINLSQFQEVKV